MWEVNKLEHYVLLLRPM